MDKQPIGALEAIAAGEKAENATVSLTPSLIAFLDELAAARNKNRSEVLRDILAPLRDQWQRMSPEERTSAR